MEGSRSLARAVRKGNGDAGLGAEAGKCAGVVTKGEEEENDSSESRTEGELVAVVVVGAVIPPLLACRGGVGVYREEDRFGHIIDGVLGGAAVVVGGV